MKAKEYYSQLIECNNKEDFELKLQEIIISFCDEVDKLVEARHAKTYDAIHSIVSEINNKWHVMVNLSKKSENKLFYGVLNDDGFYLCLCEVKPHYKKYFEKRIAKAKQTLETIYQEQKERREKINNMYMHRVTPLNEITESNISFELLQCMAAAGSYFSCGIPVSNLEPLLTRIKFLKYWKMNGINYDEIKEFELDSKRFMKTKEILL